MKIYHLILIFILSYNCNAQTDFVGKYFMHDGGVDVPNSVLYILPENDFFLLSFDVLKSGKWKQIDKNSINLIETKDNQNPILLFARNIKNQSGIKIDVGNLVRAHSYIDFSKDVNSEVNFRPIFNLWPNCTGRDFIITKNANEANWVQITTPNNPEFGSEKLTYPFEAFSYTFPLDKKFNHFTFYYFDVALIENLDFILKKEKDKYVIFEDYELKKNALTETEIKEFRENYKKYEEQKNNKEGGIEITLQRKEIINILERPKLPPYFIAECETKNLEKDFPTVDRENGIYEVVNYKTNEYDIFKFELSQKPDIQINDIYSIEKKQSVFHIGAEIELTLTETGRIKFKELTKKNIQKPLAIVIDKKIIIAPIVNSEIEGGKLTIAGDYTESQIDELIKKLKSK